MKKNNVFLLAIFCIIIGIIFTGCWLGRTDNHCPYCKSSELKYIDKINIAYGTYGITENIYQCSDCGKTFGVFPYTPINL